MPVFPRREAIYLKFISLESLLAITHVALIINMHEIKKSPSSDIQCALIFYRMKCKTNIILSF